MCSNATYRSYLSVSSSQDATLPLHQTVARKLWHHGAQVQGIEKIVFSKNRLFKSNRPMEVENRAISVYNNFQGDIGIHKHWKIPKCKIKISISFLKWTLAYKGTKMVIYDCDKLPSTEYRPKEGNHF